MQIHNPELLVVLERMPIVTLIEIDEKRKYACLVSGVRALSYNMMLGCAWIAQCRQVRVVTRRIP